MSQSWQQLIQQSLDGVKTTLNSPGNSYFLPTWLPNNGFDPYGKKVAMNWGFALSGKEMSSAANNICTAVQENETSVCPTEEYLYVGDPSNPAVLTLGGAPGDMLVSGFSNASIQTLEAVGTSFPMQINAVIQFSTLANYPPNPTVSGNFKLVQNCCCSDNTSGPAVCVSGGASTSYTGAGTFTAVVTGSCVATATVYITTIANRVMDFSVSALSLKAPLDSQGNPNIKTSVTITDFSKNMPEKAKQSYNNLADEAFNGADGRNQILAQINSIMNVKGQLDAIGTALTKLVDEYLQSINKYPFGPMTSSMLY